MANNCLITKLKGIVDNDNLEKFGEYVITVHAQQADTVKMRLLTVKAAKEFHADIVGNGVFEEVNFGSTTLTNVKNATIPANTVCYLTFGVGDYECHFNNKYDIITFSNDANVSNPKCCFRVNLEDIKYWVSAINLKPAYNCFGDIEELSNLVSLETINIRNTDVTGDIKDFANNPNLSNINVAICPGITGTLESLAEGLVAKGRTSGTLIISSTTISYQGVIYNGVKQITFDPTASGGYTVTTLE